MITSTPYPRDGAGVSASSGFTAPASFPIRHSISRGRQSYAHPFQQVFEETRSMMVHDGQSIMGELSVFEMTLGKNRLSLPAASVEDILGAMDSLHQRFGVVIGSMTDRSQIFEVVNAWIDDICTAMQHQRTNETDLSDSNFRKLQNLLQKEVETWALIYLLYYLRLNDDDGEAKEPFNRVIRDKYCVNEEPYIAEICESDPVLKEMFVIQQWLQQNFEKNGPPDLSEKFFIWENTWDAIKRDRLLNKPSSQSMVTHVDPDAPTREKKQLHPLDDEENKKVLRGAFYYIRTGDIENAISYLVKSGERIKAAGLSGYQFTCKLQSDPETGEQQEARTQTILPAMEYLPKANRQARPRPDFEIRGNPKRSLWKRITWNICEKNGMSKYDRALFGSVCGHREAMLDVAQTWEDRLWSLVRASIDVTLEGALREASFPNNRKELPESYWAQKLSIAECIEKADALSPSDPLLLTDRLFQLLQKCVMMDKIDEYLVELAAVLPKVLSSFEHPLLNGHVSRFYSHVLLFFGIVGLPYSQDLIDISLDHYISVMVDVNLFTKIPYYVQKLSDERKIPTIVRHVNVRNRLSRPEIEEFLQNAQTNELDVLPIAIAVVDKLRDDEDDFSVENLDWISCCYDVVENSAQVMYEFLKYTIWISRKYLTLGNIEKVKKLIGKLTHENVTEVAQISETLEHTLVREYICYKEYLNAEEALSAWRTAMGQKPLLEPLELPTAATKADRTVFQKKKKEQELLETKWQRAVDFHLNSAIEKFINILKFPLGWLRECYNPMDEDDKIHVGAVRRIVLRKVVNILLRLIQDKNDNRTTRDFIYVLCDDKRNILQELSPPEIANIFKVVEQFTRQKVSNIMFLPK